MGAVFFGPARLIEESLLARGSSTSQGSQARVGVRELRNSNGAAIRIFYPAAEDASVPGPSSKPAPMFRNSLAVFVEGYMHTFLKPAVPPFVLSALTFLVSCLALMSPLQRTKLPRCFEGLDAKKGEKLPLVLWSHGLTGTGCEHGSLALALALKGNVVALLHHSDGSSSMTDLLLTGGNNAPATMTRFLYEHPEYAPYDTGFRQKQVEHRAREVEEAREIILSLSNTRGSFLAGLVDPSKVVVGGFSFGAATAGLVAATASPGLYKAVVLIDGWWHIELPKLK
ncbi:Alpha/Beta hydrolase protein, partial [Baffinella frigidus]